LAVAGAATAIAETASAESKNFEIVIVMSS